MNVKQKMKMQIRVMLTTKQILFRIAHFGVLKMYGQFEGLENFISV